MSNLETLLQKREALDEQIADAKRQKATGQYDAVLSVLKEYSDHFTPAQKKTLTGILGGRSDKSANSPAPIFQLPDGSTWVGRGMDHKQFSSWAKSAEGKAWRAKNPDMAYPPYPGAEDRARDWTRKKELSAKAAKPVGKKTAKKTAKKTVKKAAK